MLKPHLHQLFDITIDDLGVAGEGVGHLDGFTIFIDGALPGEHVEAELFQSKRHFGRAHLRAIHQASLQRVAPPCPLFDRCGGCQLMHLAYSEQLEFKRSRVIRALRHIAKVAEPNVAPCLASPSELFYRNKIQLLACKDSRGEIALGLYARGSHNIVEVDKCYIHCPSGEELFQHIRAILKEMRITPYDAVAGSGELRHLLIKTAMRTNSSLVVLVTGGPASAELKRAAEEMMRRVPAVKGIVHNINRACNNVILGTEYHQLCGHPSIDEEVCGLHFKISAASFFQVNPLQAENLYRKALEFAALKPGDSALDAYCGVGTLSLLIAQQCKGVVGIESVPEAVKDASENSHTNGIGNATFVCADTEEYLKAATQAFDVVFLNPPRKGCEASVLEALGGIKPRQIIYISCDPATLARDIALLCNRGFQLDRVQPYDMFPQTAHVECVAALTRTI